jgi:outer membrane beta-barrel protein
MARHNLLRTVLFAVALHAFWVPAAIAAPGSSDDDEYNFSWLDPDKKVYVLQNRKYRKKDRLAIYISGAINLSNPYRSEYMAIPRATYSFSEQFGAEVFFATVSNADNENLKALKKVSASALPFVREHRSYYGGLLIWTPWYSKLNFFNKILYYDWFLKGGLGQVSTALDRNRVAANASDFVLENFTAIYFGTGMNFFVTRNVLARLDLIGMTYGAKGADNVTELRQFNYDFAVGLGYLF